MILEFPNMKLFSTAILPAGRATSFIRPSPESEAHTFQTPAQTRWTEIAAADLPKWCLRLVDVKNASIKQHPTFNERFRRPFVRPVYLKYQDQAGNTSAFVCVVTMGFGVFRIGVVIDGPVILGNSDGSDKATAALVRWLRSRGYAFVRFTHRESIALQSLVTLANTVTGNSVPFVPVYGAESAVRVDKEDALLLAGFQRIARQEIRYAREAKCVLQRHSNANHLRDLWQTFACRAKEKGFHLGRLKHYESIFAVSNREDLVRVYTAYYEGCPAYSVLIIRAREEAYPLMATLNKSALGDRPSPCSFVHWNAMRDYRELGCNWYSFGSGRNKPCYAFKDKFQPVALPTPATITLVLRPAFYRTWKRIVLPAIRTMI